ncbi:MAG TPA: hypothetical protein PLY17_15115, partial [Candidatus Hydrogenedentes bacterium]|nr:hypothetical protein [Candidatus Hydrogenedentota bacterium]
MTSLILLELVLCLASHAESLPYERIDDRLAAYGREGRCVDSEALSRQYHAATGETVMTPPAPPAVRVV